jgi:AcrR family transcriptional regulator
MPKIVDHNQYRKELLGQCFNLFAEKGYAAITMRQIATGLGVSTGTLYHYFPSKEALFEQLLEEMEGQDILQVSTEMADIQNLPDRLKAGFAFLERNHDYFFKQLLIFTDYYQQLSREKNQNNALERGCDRIQNFMTQILGLPSPEITQFLFSMVDGLCLSQIYGRNAAQFAPQAELIIKMLIAYLEKYEPASLEPRELPTRSDTVHPIG